MTRMPARFVRALLLLALLPVAPAAVHAADIQALRVWAGPDHTRAVFDISGPLEYKLFTLENPDRLVLDIEGSTLSETFSAPKASGLLGGVRTGKQGGRDLRVVFDLTEGVRPKSFLLPPADKLGHRLVIDLLPTAAKAAPVVRTVEQAVPSTERNVIIAIDAGHGGEDPGAIGPGGLHEKRVVLAIAKELESLFNREQGYRAVMIREGDYYIGLKQRRDLARKTQADLLISVHADAFTSPKAQGSSVYALSNRGASSAMAAFLAASENSTDAIGGVLIEGKDDDLVKILTDLSMTASLEASLRIGSHVLDRMGRLTHLHSKRVEQAAFAVLKAPDIPSILVETGFISNPEEARKLANAGHQRKLARAIFDGVHHHFSDSPPPDTYLAWSKSNRRQEYRISHGDTLSGIAQRYQVSVGALREHNGLNDNSIRAGQVLKIP